MKLGSYLLGPNDENQGIYTGDARELVKAIPDESVDLIFTDPVYDQVDDYRWLAEAAARVLKPNSPALIFCGNAFKALVIDALRCGGLSYRWDFSLHFVGRGGTYWHGKIAVGWASLLWFEKGHFVPLRGIPDRGAFPRGMRADYDFSNTIHGKWSKSTAVFEWRINAFSETDSIVLDPFTGGGTVPAVCKMRERYWLAFEIDPDTADLARKRICKTQPPLKMPMPKQLDLISVS